MPSSSVVIHFNISKEGEFGLFPGRKPLMSDRVAFSIGLEMSLFMPIARNLSLSPCMAWPVMATIGMSDFAGKAPSRMALDRVVGAYCQTVVAMRCLNRK